MLPTLNGRIQSRIFFLAVIGGPFTFLMASILPATLDAGGASIDVPWKYRLQDGFVVLGYVALFGIVWECIYHFLMQWRWEKDWPTFFGFATILNEGALIYFLGDNGLLPGIAGRGATDVHLLPLAFFIPFFIVVWIAVWLWVNGPMRVFNLHWRFFGGRLV